MSDHEQPKTSIDSVEILRRDLEDNEFRRSITEVFYFGSLLAGCVVDGNYKVPDSLVQPIRFTPLGQEVFQAVREKKPRLKHNELKLAVFLTFGCAAGLLVDAQTNAEALRRALTLEIQARRILFAYIFGRELHDTAADLYPKKISFNNRETVNLLKRVPIGVFQEGYTTVGPFGCIVSDTSRQMLSSTAAPGYLCSDATCNEVHAIHLSTAAGTAGSAPIIRARRAVDDYVTSKFAEHADDHARVLHEARARELDIFRFRAPEALFETLADALSETELRSVTELAIRKANSIHGQSEFSKRLSVVIGSPSEFVVTLDRAHLLQLLMLLPDETIMSCVDEAVLNGDLPLSEYETRSRRAQRFSQSAIRAEIGFQGIQLTGSGALVAKRLMDLLHRLYYASEALQPADLAYLLKGVPSGTSEEELLNLAVRQLTPERIIRDLILASRSAANEASKFLGVRPGIEDREELFRMLLWKLGSPSDVVFTDLVRLRNYSEKLSTGDRLPSSPTEDELRGDLSNMFTAMEDALQRSLEFATWSLTTDHFLARDGFSYDPTPNGHIVSFIDENAPLGDSEPGLKRDGRNTLAPLGTGFSRLAIALQAVDPALRLRPDLQIPSECRYTARPFAFPYTLPFLNLSGVSQDAVIQALKSMAQIVQDSSVLKVRNAAMHGNSAFPTHAELRVALEKIGSGRRILETTGLYPRSFKLVRSTADGLGRAELTYTSDEMAVTLHKPSWASAPRLPSGSSQLLIVPVAGTVSAGPLRFRLKRRHGDDDYWKGWPKRWKVETSYSASDGPTEIEELGQFVG